MKALVHASLAVLILAFTGCSGGMKASPPAQTGASSTNSTSSSLVRSTVTIRVPATSSAQAIRPKYVSPSTLGVAITVYGVLATAPPGPTAVADLSSTSPLCTNNPDGSRNCTVSVLAPIGNDNFIVTTYDNVPAGNAPQGSILSTTTLQFVILAGQTNTVSLTLNGVPSRVVLSPPGFLVPPSQTNTFTFNVNAKDADGNYIVGPGTYTNPIALSVGNDPNHTITLSASTISSPAATTVTGTYNGGSLPGVATITGTATGAAPGSLTVQSSSAVTTVTVLVPPPGVVASISVSLGNPNLPTGVAGSTPVTVTVKDASGNPISGQYSSAIQLTSSDPSVTIFPTGITNSAAGIMANFTGAARSAVTITATAASPPVSGTATMMPATNVVNYPIPQANANAFQIIQGPDGGIYFGEIGPEIIINPSATLVGGGQTPIIIGRLDPISGQINTWQQLGADQFNPIGLAFAGDGALWVSANLSNAMDRISMPLPGAVITIPLPVSSPSPLPTPPTGMGARPRQINQIGGTLYVSLQGTHQIATIGASAPYTTGTIALPTRAAPEGSAVGADGNLWVADFHNNTILRVAPLPAPTAVAFPTNIAGMMPRFVASGSDGNLYLSMLSNSGIGGALERFTTAGVGAQINLPGGSYPDTIVNGPAGTLYFADFGAAGIGMVTTAGSVQSWPIATNPTQPTDLPNAVAYASDGSIYFTTNSSGALLPINSVFGTPIVSYSANEIRRLILAQAWTLYPQGPIAVNGIGSAAGQLIGMAESGDSSPFTASTNNSAIATVASLPGFSHNFFITGVSPGVCALTVTDRTGRTFTTQVNVTQTTGTVQSLRRRTGVQQ